MAKPKVIKASERDTRAVSDYERDVLELLSRSAGGVDGQGEVLTPAAILAEARNVAETKIREAFEEGLRRGVEEGRSRFLESVSGAAELLEQASVELRAARERFVESMEPQLVALAFRVAERILRREVQVDPDVVLRTARAALDELVGGEHVTVRVSPKDFEALRRYKVTLLEDFDGIAQMDVIADDSVSPGGCVVDSGLAHVDARIEAQLDHMFQQLQD